MGRAKEISSPKTNKIEVEAGGAGTEVGRTDDPLKQYRAMTPAKEKEHELTVVKRSK